MVFIPLVTFAGSSGDASLVVFVAFACDLEKGLSDCGKSSDRCTKGEKIGFRDNGGILVARG